MVICILVGLNWWMKPLYKWKSYITPPGIQMPPPTTCTERLGACLCKSYQEQQDEEEEALAKQALIRAHQNPWDTDSNTSISTSTETSYSGSAMPMKTRKDEIKKDPALIIDDIEL